MWMAVIRMLSDTSGILPNAIRMLSNMSGILPNAIQMLSNMIQMVIVPEVESHNEKRPRSLGTLPGFNIPMSSGQRAGSCPYRSAWQAAFAG